MDTLTLMDSNVAAFSKTDRTIYETIRKFPDSYAHKSISEIAEGGNFSKAALTRFAKRLGFSGFAEFQYQLKQDLEERREGAPTNAEVYGALLPTVDEAIDREALAVLAERFKTSPHVYLMGTNLSRLPAEELNMALAHAPGVFSMVPPSDVMPHYTPDDVLVIYSAITGAAHVDIVKHLSAHGDFRPHMVLVTTSTKHPLRKYFDDVFVLPTASLSTGTRAVLSDTFAFFIFNDALMSLLEHA